MVPNDCKVLMFFCSLKDVREAHLGVWHAGGSVEVVQLATKSAAAVAGEAHGIRDGGLRGLLLELALHAAMVFALEFHAVLDAVFGIAEGPVLQLDHKLWVEGRLLGSNGVQVPHTVHVVLGGSHVQGCVVVVVQTPSVGPK